MATHARLNGKPTIPAVILTQYGGWVGTEPDREGKRKTL